jgi:hypothetical protein
VNEVEPQGPLDIFQEPMAYKTGQFLADGGIPTDQTLQKRELTSIVFSKIDEPKGPIAFKNDRVRGVLEKASTDRGERGILA